MTQVVHATLPVSDEYHPAEQAVHAAGAVAAAWVLYVPGEQVVHPVDDVEPGMPAYVPGTHAVQESAAATAL
jgi:hypothetical protein